MTSLLDIAGQNLVSPMILFFLLGLGAAFARSDLSIPEAIAKGMSLYLMLSIGFKGGAGVAAHGLDGQLIAAIGAGIVLSALMPFVAFQLLSMTTSLPRVDRAAIAAHYGSISIVTFLAAQQVLDTLGNPAEPFMVAVAAAMEMPAIATALFLARAAQKSEGAKSPAHAGGATLREIMLNGSIVVLVGAFAIGWITGSDGMAAISSFIVDPFKGVLCLFLLDMGILAGRGLRESRKALTAALIAFGVYMPLIGAALGYGAGTLIGLSPSGIAIFMTLAASASYIAVPAALRLALPEARPAIYIPLALGITFPFNLMIGIPLYIELALRTG